jgi:hypothetical protein
MKAILEFDLESACDRNEHIRAINATSAYCAIHDILEELRKEYKYGTDEVISEYAYDLAKIFRSILEERNINMDHLL